VHFPGINTRFTHFNLQRGYTGLTTIITDGVTHRIDMRKQELVTPNFNHWGILKKVTAGTVKMGWRRGSGYHTSNDDLFTDDGEFTVFHTNAQTLKTPVKMGDYSKKKVYTTISGYFIPHYDKVGDVGVTQATAVIITDQLKEFKALFNTKLYKFVIGVMASQQGWLNLSLLKMLALPPLKTKYTDQELYDYFDLTDEERAIVDLATQ